MTFHANFCPTLMIIRVDGAEDCERFLEIFTRQFQLKNFFIFYVEISPVQLLQFPVHVAWCNSAVVIGRQCVIALAGESSPQWVAGACPQCPGYDDVTGQDVMIPQAGYGDAHIVQPLNKL